jgi:hypothetical protein
MSDIGYKVDNHTIIIHQMFNDMTKLRVDLARLQNKLEKKDKSNYMDKIIKRSNLKVRRVKGLTSLI